MPFYGDHDVTAASRPVTAFVPVRIRLVTPISMDRSLWIITAATEPECKIIAFSPPAQGRYGSMHGGGEPGSTRVNLSTPMRLDDVIKRIEAIPMGGTDLRPSGR
jgi:hypothetical protein